MNDEKKVRMRIKELKEKDALVSVLVLADEREERFLPVRLGGPSTKAMRLELAGGHRAPSAVQDLLANALKHMNGKLVRIELRWEDRPGLLAMIVIDQDGTETGFPTRIADALALAHRYDAPILVSEFALARQGISAGETGEKAAGADWMEAFRLTCGFTGLGRLDDAILACRRLRELDPPNESWCVTLGSLYARKGLVAAAAVELYKGLAWQMREGYVKGAVDVAKDMATLDFDSIKPRMVKAPAMIEDFATPEFNNECWGAGEVIPSPDRPGGKAYRLGTERDWCILNLLGTQTWEGARTLRVDVHVAGPEKGGKPFPLTLGLSLAGRMEGFYSSGPVELKTGWNQPVFRFADLAGLKLDGAAIGPVVNIQFLFHQGRPAGAISFAGVRLE